MKKIYILLLLISLISLSGCTLKEKHYDIRNYMTYSEYHENYKIMQITDLHFSSIDNIKEDLAYLDLMIAEAEPDLLIFTGDIFTFASKATIKYVLNHFDSYNIKWTLTYGNHDEQIYTSYEYPSLYAAQCKNALFRYFYDDDLTGIGNNIINLTREDKVVYQLFIIDSNSYSYQDGFGYDYVHQDQIEWYKKGIETINKDYHYNWTVGDEAIPSLIFQHIPLPEFENCNNENRQELQEENNNLGNPNGILREDSCPPLFNSGFFDVIKAYKSTKGIFVGHDHINNYNINYQGVRFVYGVKSSDNMYNNSDMLGYNLITLHDGTFDTSFHYHTYKEVK